MSRTMKIFSTWNLMALLCCGGVAMAADAPVRYLAQPRGSLVRIEGTSTAHDWEMEGIIIGGFVEFGPGVQLDPAQPAISGLIDGKIPVTAHAIIPVRSVHSKADHMPDVMEHLMQDAMKEAQFKRIEYTISEMTPKAHVAGKPFECDTKGELVIAGVTNKVNFPVTIERIALDMIKITGTAPVKMTAYGVTPPAPSFGLGLMRCGDDVKITFEWSLVEKK